MSQRRGHGEGSIYQETATGRWRGAIDLGYSAEGKRDRRRVGGRTKTEVRDKLRALRRKLDDGMPADRATMTVTQLFDHYLTVVLPARDPSPNTVANYQWAMSKIEPSLGKIRLGDLTPEHVETLLASYSQLSRSALNRIKTVLGAALHEAERRSWVMRNVARLAITPPGHTAKRRALTREQALILLDHACGHRLEAAIAIGLTLGLRPGELLGLSWSDLSLNAEPAVLHVRRSLRQHRGHLSLGPLKTSSSFRTLELPAGLIDTLSKHRARQNTERLAAGPLWENLDLVFTTEIGTPLDPANFRRAFQKLTQSAGLGHWTPYELRHTAVTLASEAGVAAERIADMAGHRDTRMVMTTYRHASGPSDTGRIVSEHLSRAAQL